MRYISDKVRKKYGIKSLEYLIVKIDGELIALYDWYKDLTEAEKVFRECKPVNLEVRPVYVRKEESTRGHVFVVMLAYMIIRRLRDAWAGFDLTVEGCPEQLATICSMEVTVKGQKTRCLMKNCMKYQQPSRKSTLELCELKFALQLQH